MKKGKNWLTVIFGIIFESAMFMTNIFLIGLLLIIFINVIMRYVVREPLYWGDEVMTFFMILMVYLGFAYSLMKGGHIRMTAITDRLSIRKQNILWVVTSILGIFYAGYILYAGIMLLIDTIKIGSFSTITRLPLAPWQAVMVLGLILLFASMIWFAVRRIHMVHTAQSDEVNQEVEITE